MTANPAARHRRHAARRPSVAHRDAHAHRGHAADLRRTRRRRLLVAGVLGRRDLRRLRALPRRRPLGAPAPAARGAAEHEDADAAARPEPARLSPLRRRRRARLRGALVENGMDVLRIFDALNDIRNLETAIAATKSAGGHAQGTLCYTTSPVHGAIPRPSSRWRRTLERMDCDTIAIKDMAGLLTPDATSELVRGLKQAVNLPIHLHSHRRRASRRCAS